MQQTNFRIQQKQTDQLRRNYRLRNYLLLVLLHYNRDTLIQLNKKQNTQQNNRNVQLNESAEVARITVAEKIPGQSLKMVLQQKYRRCLQQIDTFQRREFGARRFRKMRTAKKNTETRKVKMKRREHRRNEQNTKKFEKLKSFINILLKIRIDHINIEF